MAAEESEDAAPKSIRAVPVKKRPTPTMIAICWAVSFVLAGSAEDVIQHECLGEPLGHWVRSWEGQVCFQPDLRKSRISKKALGPPTCASTSWETRGFTLIELLVVIAII